MMLWQWPFDNWSTMLQWLLLIYRMEGTLSTLDWNDTFLDFRHLRSSFPDHKVMLKKFAIENEAKKIRRELDVQEEEDNTRPPYKWVVMMMLMGAIDPVFICLPYWKLCLVCEFNWFNLKKGWLSATLRMWKQGRMRRSFWWSRMSTLTGALISSTSQRGQYFFSIYFYFA